jgi:hypothetical protein
MIIGLFVSLVCFMQTRTMQCLCNCKITRVTIIRTPQEVQPPQAPIAPAPQSMEESHQQAEPSSVESMPVIIITPAVSATATPGYRQLQDVPGSVSEEIAAPHAMPA